VIDLPAQKNFRNADKRGTRGWDEESGTACNNND
jgi:hypothetical protein